MLDNFFVSNRTKTSFKHILDILENFVLKTLNWSTIQKQTLFSSSMPHSYQIIKPSSISDWQEPILHIGLFMCINSVIIDL